PRPARKTLGRSSDGKGGTRQRTAHVPDANGSIGAGGRDGLAVGADGNCFDPSIVTQYRADLPAREQVPHSRAALVAAGQQGHAVRREGMAAKTRDVPKRAAERFTRGDVPLL